MGKKVLYASVGLSAVSVIIGAVCLFLPWHTLRFMSGSVRILQITTYTTSVSNQITDSPQVDIICQKLQNESIALCNLRQPMALQEQAQWWCISHNDQSFTRTCSGYSGAFTVGLAAVVFGIINWILQISGCVLAIQYTTVAPKKKYRQVAQLLYIIAVLVQVIVHICYLFLVLSPLDDVRPSDSLPRTPAGTPFIEPSRGNGTGHGYILTWLAILIEVIIIILYHFAKSSEEERFEEAKEHSRFVQELEMHGQAAAASMNPAGMMAPRGGMGPGPSPGYPMAGAGYGYPQSPALGAGMASTTAPPANWGPGASQQLGSSDASGRGPPYF